jgi:hypothetical protein
VDLGDVVVGVVRTDLGFELVVEQEGVKRYQGRQDIRRLTRTLLAS